LELDWRVARSLRVKNRVTFVRRIAQNFVTVLLAESARPIVFFHRLLRVSFAAAKPPRTVLRARTKPPVDSPAELGAHFAQKAKHAGEP